MTKSFLLQQGLEQDYLKDIIEYFDSIKEPQIAALGAEIDHFKKQLNIENISCQQKSNYEKEIYAKTARPFFKMKKLAYEQIIKANSRSIRNKTEGIKRKRGEESDQVNQPESKRAFPANAKCSPSYEKKDVHNKLGHCNEDHIENSGTKENRNAASNCIPEKERPASDANQNIKQSLFGICKPDEKAMDKKTGSTKEDKSSLEENSLNKNQNDGLNSVRVDKTAKLNNQVCVDKAKEKIRPTGNIKQVLQCKEDESERSIRFAKLFCSRSIKSSSRAKSLQCLENLIEHKMSNVLPLIKKDQSLKINMERKRKRETDNESENSSALNSVAPGSERKRLKYDVLKVI